MMLSVLESCGRPSNCTRITLNARVNRQQFNDVMIILLANDLVRVWKVEGLDHYVRTAKGSDVLEILVGLEALIEKVYVSEPTARVLASIPEGKY